MSWGVSMAIAGLEGAGFQASQQTGDLPGAHPARDCRAG